MKNPEKLIPVVSIDLGDYGKFDVKCSMGVLIRYQLMTGKDLFKQVDREMSPLEYIQFLACAIYKENPQEHLVELQEAVNAQHLQDIIKIVRAVFGAGQAEDADDSTESGEEKKSE